MTVSPGEISDRSRDVDRTTISYDRTLTSIIDRLPLLAWYLVDLGVMNDATDNWDDDYTTDLRQESGNDATDLHQSEVTEEERHRLMRQGLRALSHTNSEIAVRRLFIGHQRRYLGIDLFRVKDTHVYPVAVVAATYQRPVAVVMVVMNLVHKLSRVELNARKHRYQGWPDDPWSLLRCPDLVETIAEGVSKEDTDRVDSMIWEFWFQIDLLRYRRLTVGLSRYLSLNDLHDLTEPRNYHLTLDELLNNPLALLVTHIGLYDDR